MHIITFEQTGFAFPGTALPSDAFATSCPLNRISTEDIAKR